MAPVRVFFGSSRGIRQEGPISPYIFVMVMEFWSMHMDMAIASGALQPLKRDMPVIVSHLLFVDDMLLFCKDKQEKFQYHQLSS